MPLKKKGKRSRTDEQPKAEPKAKRQKRDPNQNNSLQTDEIAPQAKEDEAARQQQVEAAENQQNLDHEHYFENADTYNEYATQQQTDQIQAHSEEAADSQTASYDTGPFEIDVIQAEQWDVLSPQNRLYALNWSLIKAIGVLEYLHIDLIEAQSI